MHLSVHDQMFVIIQDILGSIAIEQSLLLQSYPWHILILLSSLSGWLDYILELDDAINAELRKPSKISTRRHFTRDLFAAQRVGQRSVPFTGRPSSASGPQALFALSTMKVPRWTDSTSRVGVAIITFDCYVCVRRAMLASSLDLCTLS